jgi:ABC-type multidrug transport system fused ATPase/permease subunit
METLVLKEESIPPTVRITPLNFLTVEWITSLLYQGAKKPLEQHDLYRLPIKNQAESISNVLSSFWDAVRAGKDGSLFKTLVWKYGWVTLVVIILQGLSISCTLATPIFLQQMIHYLTPGYARSDLLWDNGIGISFILFLLQIFGTVFQQTSSQLCYSLQIDFKTILTGAVYEKSLRQSQAASRKYTQGQILNIVNVDVEKVSLLFLQFASVIMSPIQIGISIYLLGQLIGVSVWAGASTLIGILVLMLSVVGFLAAFQKKFLEFGDKRLKLIREVLYGMKVIKFRTLEAFFFNRIGFLRGTQVDFLKKYYMVQIYLVGLIQITPISMPIVAFLVYASLGGSIAAPIIFPALNLFNSLFQPLHTLPQTITAFVVAIVSFKRVSEFLVSEEGGSLPLNGSENQSAAIVIRNATFQYEKVADHNQEENRTPPPKKSLFSAKESQPGSELELLTASKNDKVAFKLADLNLTIPKGSKVAIVGPVGCGKSTLLCSLIGDVPLIQGDYTFFGNVGYCSQQPWILTDTIEGNITFHEELNEAKMNEILHCCGLDEDLKAFPARIKTEIGEKGVNLSGGQKARVALARAMYRNPDILLLDDPISALDAHVGRQVFDLAIKQYLAEKTVVLVTHQLHFLPEMDHILVMDKGQLVEQGSYKELIQSGKVLKEMMKSYRLDEDNAGREHVKSSIVRAEVNNALGGIIVAEEKQRGSVSLKIFWHYFDKCGGIPHIVLFLTAAILSSGTQVINNLWLSWWTSDTLRLSFSTYMLVYGLLGVGQFVFACIVNSVFLIGSFRAAKYYHQAALKRLMRATMSFFDSQPIGRIINRMSKDVESIDQNIWIIMFLAVIAFAGALAALIFLSYVDQRMLALIIPLMVLYFFILKYYQRSNIEFKRFESNNRSFLNAHISETLAGISTVKAYQAESKFITRQRYLMDLGNVPTFLRLMAQVWVSLRLELLSATVTLLLSILGVVSGGDPSLFGLSLTYAFGFSKLLALLLFTASQLENEFNAIERLAVYCDELPQEPPESFPTDPKVDEWPINGHIEFQNVHLSYPTRPEVLILKNLTFSVRAGEKVGVIGRTGSGKSTLMTALFRLVELKEGSILIDGKGTLGSLRYLYIGTQNTS